MTVDVRPNDEERPTIVVIAAYRRRIDPTECQPADDENCIVGRRELS